MARPQSEARLGFYPFPEPALPLLEIHLRCRDPAAANALDPCAGEGVALKCLTTSLDIPQPQVYAIEIDVGRSERLRANLPTAQVLGPSSFLGTACTPQSFGLVYCNPPYGAEMGGGRRDELTFLSRAMGLLVTGGVACFVLPEGTLLDGGQQGKDIRRALACRLRDVSLWKPPADFREYGETVVLGYKRASAVPKPDGPLAKDWWSIGETIGPLGACNAPYDVPAGRPPKAWAKVDFTPAELRARVAASPINRAFDPPRAKARKRPPLPLSQGHVVLVLASGEFDGLIEPEGEPPHALRGTTCKVPERKDDQCEESVDEEGRVTYKEVVCQRRVLTIRTVDTSGIIRTFTDMPAQPA